MKKYTNASLEIIAFDFMDVITASVVVDTPPVVNEEPSNGQDVPMGDYGLG